MKKLVLLLAGVTLLLLLFGCATNIPNVPVACTAEAQACPDGSYVSRDPNNNCEFFACPGSHIQLEMTKTTYLPNEEIEIAITNESTKKITYSTGIGYCGGESDIIVFKRTENGFVKKFFGTKCEVSLYRPLEWAELDPQAKATLKIKVGNLELGTYKASLQYKLDGSSQEYRTETPEFEIVPAVEEFYLEQNVIGWPDINEKLTIDNKVITLENQFQLQTITLSEDEWTELVDFFADSGIFLVTQEDLNKLRCDQEIEDCPQDGGTTRLKIRYNGSEVNLAGGSQDSEPKALVAVENKIRELKQMIELKNGTNEELSAKTDKNIYHINEEIKIEFENKYTGKYTGMISYTPYPECSNGFQFWRKMPNGFFKEVEFEPEAEIQGCPDSPVEKNLEPGGKTAIFIKFWPNKTSDGEQFPIEGIYKVSIEHNVQNPNTLVIAKTNEFEIIDIQVKTSKNIYDKGEIIEFTLSNNSGRPIYIMQDFPFKVYERKGTFSAWTELKTSNSTDYVSLPQEIKNGESKIFEWKGTSFETMNGIFEEIQADGKFFIQFEYSFDAYLPADFSYTNNFNPNEVILFDTPGMNPGILPPIMVIESNEFDIYSVAELDECVNNSGEWTFSRDLSGYFCNYKTGDFGNTCTDNGQCEGDCLAQEITDTQGTCSEWITTLGCSYTLASGIAESVCHD